MNKFIKDLLYKAKKEKDLEIMKGLYVGNPYNLTIKFEYAKLLVIKGKYDEGKALFLELLSSKNSNFSKIELAKLEANSGNYDKAREYLNELVEAHDVYGIFALAKLEVLLGNMVEARKIFESIKNDKNMPYVRVELGKLEAKEKNIDKARSYFLESINRDHLVSAKMELGRFEASLGNLDKARNTFLSIVQSNKDLIGYLEIGRLEVKLGNYDKAREYFNSLLGTHYNLSAILELGKLEAILGNKKEAKERFKSLMDTSIDRFAYQMLVLFNLKEQNYEEAVIYAKKALEKGYRIKPDILMDLSKSTNIFFNVDYERVKYSYTINQAMDYDPYIAMDHIIERHENPESRDFSLGVDVHALFNKIPNILNDEYKVAKLIYNDVYVIPYENVGTSGQNYLKVVTIPNTKEIITMYPVFSRYDNIEEDIDKMSDGLTF